MITCNFFQKVRRKEIYVGNGNMIYILKFMSGKLHSPRPKDKMQ